MGMNDDLCEEGFLIIWSAMPWLWCEYRSSRHKRTEQVRNPATSNKPQHRMIDVSSAWPWQTIQFDLDSWQNVRALLQVCHYLLHYELNANISLNKISSHKIVSTCNYTGLVSIKTGMPIGKNSSSPMNSILIWAAYALDTERRLPECVKQYHTGRMPSMRFEILLGIMDKLSSWEL